MPFDAKKFATHLRTKAKDTKNSDVHLGQCAKWVRLALEDAGANTKGHPIPAKEYGPLLMRNGFHPLPVKNPQSFPFLMGDIVVIQPAPGGNPAGHIAGYDGKNWISDFVQLGFWPGPKYIEGKPSYVVYRR
jgi:hypothetical protein